MKQRPHTGVVLGRVLGLITVPMHITVEPTIKHPHHSFDPIKAPTTTLQVCQSSKELAKQLGPERTILAHYSCVITAKIIPLTESTMGVRMERLTALRFVKSSVRNSAVSGPHLYPHSNINAVNCNPRPHDQWVTVPLLISLLNLLLDRALKQYCAEYDSRLSQQQQVII